MRIRPTWTFQLRRLACLLLTLPALTCAKMEPPAASGERADKVAFAPSTTTAAGTTSAQEKEAAAESGAAAADEEQGKLAYAVEVEARAAANQDAPAREAAAAPPPADVARPRLADGLAMRLSAPSTTEAAIGAGSGGGGEGFGRIGQVGGGWHGVADKRQRADVGSEQKRPGGAKTRDAIAPIVERKTAAALALQGPSARLFADADDASGALGAGDSEDIKLEEHKPAPEPEEGDKGGVFKAKRDVGDGDGDGDRDGAGEADACAEWPSDAEPMPRRCHLAPTYHAGRASWQRRLQTLAGLPRELAAADWTGRGGPTLDAPDKTALAVDARLDRDAIDGPGRVWMRIWLRSTERWGMRRPPFDLAVILGPNAIQREPTQTCATLQALVADVGAQDRFSLIWGATVDPRWDGISGIDAAARVNALCAEGLASRTGGALLAQQHAVARDLLAHHAAAEHRVAGTRVVVALAARDEDRLGLDETVSAGVQEPTLTSLLLVGGGDADAAWWRLADSGHGAIEVATPDHPERAAKALWQTWGRVVARLVRVDIRLAPGVVARRVVGSRALDAQETLEVRRREQAVDSNLAKVAGVASDRKDDGLGMTMLIPAFLGSDDHAIDIELEVPGPGAVADVVLDYKDLVRMANAKATTRAALDRLPPAISRTVAGPDPQIATVLPTLRRLRAIAASAPDADLEPRFMAALPASIARGTQQLWRSAAAEASASRDGRARLVALMDTWVATVGGCHVASRR